MTKEQYNEYYSMCNMCTADGYCTGYGTFNQERKRSNNNLKTIDKCALENNDKIYNMIYKYLDFNILKDENKIYNINSIDFINISKLNYK